MADANSSTSDSMLSQAQLKAAMEAIASRATTIAELYRHCPNEVFCSAAMMLVNQIGLIADRCTGFDVCGLDSWLQIEDEKEPSHVN